MNLRPRSSTTQLINLSEGGPVTKQKGKNIVRDGRQGRAAVRAEKKKGTILNTTFKTSGTQLRYSTHKSVTNEVTLLHTKERENQLSEIIKKEN